MGTRTTGFWRWLWLAWIMMADPSPLRFDAASLRISIKDYHRNKNLKVLLFRPPFPSRGWMVRMNGKAWPERGGAVCMTRLLAALRKSLVRSGQSPAERSG